MEPYILQLVAITVHACIMSVAIVVCSKKKVSELAGDRDSNFPNTVNLRDQCLSVHALTFLTNNRILSDSCNTIDYKELARFARSFLLHLLETSTHAGINNCTLQLYLGLCCMHDVGSSVVHI